jgi:tetratricopeptide (TPR) repeat protein
MANTTTQTNPKKKKKKPHIATWIASASAVVAIIAAIISYEQVNVASQQNIAAEQQQLVMLTTSIAQQFAQEQATLDQAAGTLTGAARTAALSNAGMGITEQLEADGEAGAVLITNLNGNGVAGVEYATIGRALAAGEDTAQAISYYQDAVDAPPHTAGTRAEALRGEALLYYSLGRSVTGHADMMGAIKAYSGHPELTQFDIDTSIAQSYLLDAQNQLYINGCEIAAADMTAAEKALSPLGGAGETTTITELYNSDISAYRKLCP